MPLLARFWKPKAYGQTVLPDRSLSIGPKIGEKCQNSKTQMRHFGWFSNTVLWLVKFCWLTLYLKKGEGMKFLRAFKIPKLPWGYLGCRVQNSTKRALWLNPSKHQHHNEQLLYSIQAEMLISQLTWMYGTKLKFMRHHSTSRSEASASANPFVANKPLAARIISEI